MSRLHVSLAGLRGVVLASGISLAALRNASPTWAGVTLLLVLCLLTTSILGIAYRRRAARAWWLGFGLFGWGYFVLAFAPWPSGVRPDLPTTALLAYLHAKISPPEIRVMGSFELADRVRSRELVVLDEIPRGPGVPLAAAEDQVVVVSSIDPAQFERVGHCLLALAAGLVGALLARRFQGGAPARRTLRGVGPARRYGVGPRT